MPHSVPDLHLFEVQGMVQTALHFLDFRLVAFVYFVLGLFARTQALSSDELRQFGYKLLIAVTYRLGLEELFCLCDKLTGMPLLHFLLWLSQVAHLKLLSISVFGQHFEPFLLRQ